jgi:predicted Zn-dependent protease
MRILTKHNIIEKAVFTALLLIMATSCGKVMITGRSQFLLYNQGQITSLSDQAYTELMSKSSISANARYNKMVKEVGFDLTNAVTKYINQNGMQSALKGINWKFDVLKDETVNAFCLPNGNIIFYEGIMKLTDTPDLVAVVMGHEIAHALAKHGNERMSQAAVIEATGQALNELVKNKPETTQLIFGLAFGVGSQLGMLLPYSRKHEYEADRLGLIIMAMAGYDINVAPGFWEKMSQSGSNIPEFFSTHPSDANRIKKIRAVLPEAAGYIPSKTAK